MVNLDFNQVEAVAPSGNFGVIPKGTVARAVLKVKWNDHPIDGADACLFKAKTGSVFMEFEWTVISGQFAGRKIWDKKYFTDNTTARSRGMILRIIEDNYAINPKDDSPEVRVVRKLKRIGDLDGFEACVLIGVSEGSLKDDGTKYEDRNDIIAVLNTSDRGYIRRETPPKAIPSSPSPSVEGANVPTGNPIADSIEDDPIPF